MRCRETSNVILINFQSIILRCAITSTKNKVFTITVVKKNGRTTTFPPRLLYEFSGLGGNLQEIRKHNRH